MYTLQVIFDNVYKYSKIFSNEEHEYEMSEKSSPEIQCMNLVTCSGRTGRTTNLPCMRTLPNSETTTVSLAFRESYTYMHVFCHKGDWRPLTLCKDLNRSLYPI